MILVVHPGSRIRMLTFYPSRIPDPGVKKALDPGSGSATLMTSLILVSREERDFDLSLVLILFMAVSTVMLGSLWSGYAKQSLRLR